MPRCRAWIFPDVKRAIEAEATSRFPLETGGVLMGYWDTQGSDVVITTAIGPGPRASHRPTGFMPDQQYQLDQIARHYEGSGRRFTYLGDWHTHPRGTEALSGRDRRTLAWIARAPEARAPHPLMLLAVGGDPWELVVWHATIARWWRLTAEMLTIEVMPGGLPG
jgi:integrative and conjugative element protein (TIGR02256 family)